MLPLIERASTTAQRIRALPVAVLVFCVAMAVYAAMLSPHVAIGDEAEAQTVPYILGIGHPAGFPAFTLFGWLFSHALPFGAVAQRINAFTAICTALTAAGVAALAMTLRAESVAAILAGFAFAFGRLVWSGGLHANAQVLAQTCSIYALLACIVFARSGNGRIIAVAFGCCGIGLSAHPVVIWVLPAVGVAVWWQRAAIDRHTVLISSAAFALPLLMYAYLPLRSIVVAHYGLDPAAAAPMFGTGSFAWDNDAPRTWPGFLDEVLAQHEGDAQAKLTMALDPRQWGAAAAFWLRMAFMQYTAALLLLAATGTAVLARRDPRALSVLAAGTLGGISFANIYQADTHIDRYMVFSFAVVAALAAVSTTIHISRVAALPVRGFVTLALAVIAGSAFVYDRPRIENPLENGAAIVAAVRADTPDNAIVVAQWNDAAALGYGAFVERALGSRTIVSAWPWEHADEYRRWARVRPVIMYLSPLIWTAAPPITLRTREHASTIPSYRVLEVVP